MNKLQQFLRTWFHIRYIINKYSDNGVLGFGDQQEFMIWSRIEDSSNNPVSRRGNDSTNDGFPILSMLSKFLNGMNMS